MLAQWLLLVLNGLLVCLADEVVENHNVPQSDIEKTTISYPYKEYLELKPLERNNMLAAFNFEMNSTEFEVYPSQSRPKHYSVFSKLLGPILESTETRELHLRFSQAWYDAENFGKLPHDGRFSGGTGVELWALIEGDTQEEAFKKWIQLANSLSGLFCASLNFIDSASTTYPVTLFKPESTILEKVPLKKNLYLLRSALPREPICTENLTPFLKLLPAKGKAGISSLLTGHKVFNSQWSSMSIDITTECNDSTHCYYNMKQAINMILNVPKTIERDETPIPKPTPGHLLRCDESKKHDAYHCFPMGEPTDLDFKLSTLFGKVIKGGALIAEQPSKVCADVDLQHWEVGTISLAHVESFIEDEKLCFELNTLQEYDLQFKTSQSNKIKQLDNPPILASRSLSGYSQDSGGFRIDLFNPTDDDESVVAFETLPWFIRPYLHTLTITVNGTTTYRVTDVEAKDYITEIIYNLAKDRERPSHLELLMSLPAQTRLKLTFQFDKAMLLYAEYPPDANHGFEIEPAVIAILSPSKEVIYQMRTTTALLTLPTPDFSMPYNVIILTSTVMSLALGAVFNLLCKRTVTEEQAEVELAKHSILNKLQVFKSKIKKLFKKEDTVTDVKK
ncbi:hypothetical protein CANARDRAFT_199756 [[Candida] arabinofermentans NRRL YB-2248]|uniref:GPI transamidase component GPI16 n=1 Tax=[Candida] arabinofermentans NRRL YB-2248 TaxID=983967 RepID=A0A1E4SZL1_9ASCO|nr:hypothetical protein CANARDRAFT_199756 [[Candida] arabinofermentans NRRL YB-2248]